jgi:coproporphyrinogen III oxidase
MAEPVSGVLSETTMRQQATAWAASIHDAATAFFADADQGGEFIEEAWERPGGGGGLSRRLDEGNTFERAGVNRSAVEGALDRELAVRLALPPEAAEGCRFFGTGVSLVVHPRSPRIPTVHLNVRYFELVNAAGDVMDAWFGGGTDLTPTYPTPDDARHFHRVLADTCARHDAGYYPKFKGWCDRYFRNTHRGNEARGVGGIFFDHLRVAEHGFEPLMAFAGAVGRVLPEAYGPIVDRWRGVEWGEPERRLQLFRRGRYVEFNLLHDRGTTFGLQSGARTESVLMSLPPLARWDTDASLDSDPLAQALRAMLVPQDWLNPT